MINRISGKTRICGIIGDPVEHTMSPVMHNSAYGRMGLDYVYVPFHVRSDDVGKAVEGVRALNLRGINVTIPHKVTVMPFLDRLDPLAEKIGAVNTVVNDGGTLTGYNTDASGFLQALLDKGIEPNGRKVVVVGAGGASRAISFILAERGADIVILNRQLEMDWAIKLAGKIAEAFRKDVKALELSRDNLAASLAEADILVNATSVGMHPNAGETAVPGDLLRPGLAVFDSVYNPLQTRLLKEAARAGGVTVSGLDMLVWQGAMAFEMWTGVKPPVDMMKEEAIKTLSR